ncbi:LacI family DNA-binding transcriptional regulator [Actinoplanes sp. NPDC024001]|uniref:LacI family DNA-binding transcriptional regulator n=1 Tax=Actinoplanes sp. NPDC024001 TaxID=3154598 RepID=UPI0033DAD0BE
MAVTLADVARLAGVSPATVSRVINDSSKRVNEDLRERVLAAVAQLHYVPNAHAQHVARPRKSAVGVIVHDVSDPYFAEITRGLQRQAGAHDRLLVICNSYREPDRELQYVALLRAQQVHALILAGSGYHDDAFTERLNAELGAYQQAGGRVAVIGRHRLVGSAVLPANEDGAYALGLRLLGLGHRRVAVIAGPRWLTTTTDRLTGFCRAADELGVELPASRVLYTDFTRDGGAAAATELLDTEPGLTALVALNDSMAVGALAALRGRGVRVPDDISVTGFDDMPIARDVTPSLTTVRLPLVEMGERAMALALGDDPGPRAERAEATVVWRESCAPPPS